MEKNKRVLIFVNGNKEENNELSVKFCKILKKNKVEYSFLTQSDLNSVISSDVLYVLGGDGTILRVVEFANRNNIPIIGINAGNLGFLTEFEKEEAADSIKLFLSDKLKKDERITLSLKADEKDCTGLNDVVLQRIYSESDGGLVIKVSVEIDGNEVSVITGDGVIISTPTGSTAYSLSAGGAILAPKINAFSMTPLSAHSLHNRPIVFSADSVCTLKLVGGSRAGLFVDGKLIKNIKEGEKVDIVKSESQTVFLRKKSSDFFVRLAKKLSYR